jgi:hypothetical protein
LIPHHAVAGIPGNFDVARGILESVKVRDIIKRIEADGWAQVSQEGSHRQYKRPVKKGRCHDCREAGFRTTDWQS